MESEIPAANRGHHLLSHNKNNAGRIKMRTALSLNQNYFGRGAGIHTDPKAMTMKRVYAASVLMTLTGRSITGVSINTQSQSR